MSDQVTMRYILHRLSFSEKLIMCFVALQTITNTDFVSVHKQYKHVIDSIVEYTQQQLLYISDDTYTLGQGDQLFGCIIYHCKNSKLYRTKNCIESKIV